MIKQIKQKKDNMPFTRSNLPLTQILGKNLSNDFNLHQHLLILYSTNANETKLLGDADLID